MSRCWEMNKEITIEGGKRTTLVIYWPNKWQNVLCYGWKIRIFPNELVDLARGFPGRMLQL